MAKEARSTCLAALIALCLMLAGCGKGDSLPDDARTRAADANVRAVWGKGLADLPADRLVLISAHNENIRNEYEWAFSLHRAMKSGRKVVFEWRSVAGGSSSIFDYLQNFYAREPNGPGIDVVWGGGDYNFSSLAKRGLIVPMRLAPDVLENVPAQLGAVGMVDANRPPGDANRLWIGSAISAFGFVYNAEMLRRCGIPPPDGTWEDLGSERFADLLSMADPTQSGSAAAGYQMIARSGKDWPDGWGKLLRVLSGAKRFTDSAGTSASAPSLGEALVAACIDFYGAVRVAEAPGQIVYVSPKGQTAFTPDPIAILKNAPHEELARDFADFALSRQGQALWCLRVGEKDGPARSALGRQPIRKDVYTAYDSNTFLDGIVNPYEAGQSMDLEGFRGELDYGVLRALVGAAAVDNVAGLRAARKALARAGWPADLVAEFHRLPDNVSTTRKMADTAKAMRKGDADREGIVADWQTFFREKYRRIAKDAPSRGV